MDPKEQQQPQPSKKEMTAAEAAKAVRRPVTKAVTDKEGNPVKDKDGNVETKTEHVEVKASEVLSFKAYDDGKVVVVTKDGKKLSNRDE